jgi:hypothetical protein
MGVYNVSSLYKRSSSVLVDFAVVLDSSTHFAESAPAHHRTTAAPFAETPLGTRPYFADAEAPSIQVSVVLIITSVHHARGRTLDG